MSARNRTPDDRTPDLLTFFVRLSPRQFAGGMELGGIVPTKHLVGTPPPWALGAGGACGRLGARLTPLSGRRFAQNAAAIDLTYLARHVPVRMLAATQLTADGVLDVQEADAQRAQAKTKLDKVRCSGACERA